MMNQTIVPNSELSTPTQIAEALSGQLPSLAPQLRKAAVYVLEHPNEIGVSSIREIADAALVKPNSLVRMARTLGFDGYEDFREPFREKIRTGNISFPDRARWLQSLSKSGKLGSLYSQMVSTAIANIESSFSQFDETHMKAAADRIVEAEKIFMLGAGVNHTLASNFAYLLKMAGYAVETLPGPGGNAVDELGAASEHDVLIAMTFKPYREDVIQAVDMANRQRLKVISISDSPASPIALSADQVFTINNATPQFFPSSVAVLALLECILAFVVADADPKVVQNIGRLDARRRKLGIYRQD